MHLRHSSVVMSLHAGNIVNLVTQIIAIQRNASRMWEP